MIQGFNPRTGEPAGKPVAETADTEVDAAVAAAAAALPGWAALPGGARADALAAVADALDARVNAYGDAYPWALCIGSPEVAGYAAARDAAPGTDVFVHSHPDQREAGSNPGYDPGVLLGPDGANGVILACPGSPAASTAGVARTARAAPSGRRIAATLPAVTALGADTGELAAKAGAVLAAGATDLRPYHAGLASAADHIAMRAVAETF